ILVARVVRSEPSAPAVALLLQRHVRLNRPAERRARRLARGWNIEIRKRSRRGDRDRPARFSAERPENAPGRPVGRPPQDQAAPRPGAQCQPWGVGLLNTRLCPTCHGVLVRSLVLCARPRPVTKRDEAPPEYVGRGLVQSGARKSISVA